MSIATMRALVAALALHGLVWLLLPRMRPSPRSAANAKVPIELELRASPPAPTVPPARQTIAAAAVRPPRLRTRPSSTSAEPLGGNGKLAASAAPPSPSEAGTAAQPPHAAIDLFARGALDAAIARVEQRAGHPADGPLADEAGRERARSGQVDPAWRDVERSIDARFRPNFDLVTSQSAGALVLAQLRAGFRHADEVGPADRHHLDFTGSAGDALALDEKLRTVRAHFAEAVERRRTEVEVVVDAAGKLIDIRVVSPSGRAQLDAVALEAVRHAVATRPPRTGARRTRARFIVEASASVTPPEVMTSADAGGGQPAAALNLLTVTFDESARKVSGYDRPLQRHVSTRVTLSYIAPEK